LLEVNESVCRPNPISQFFPRDELAGMLQEHLQNVQGLFLKVDLCAPAAQFPCTEICLEYSKAYRRPR
jgi:hypothetical protein